MLIQPRSILSSKASFKEPSEGCPTESLACEGLSVLTTSFDMFFSKLYVIHFFRQTKW